jgi:stage II sporulation protein R
MTAFIVNNATRKENVIMKKCKDLLFTVIMMLGAILIAALMPTEMDAAIYEDTLRLHILASSDSAADQEVKYVIRDRLLEKYGALLSEAESPSEAKVKADALGEEIGHDVDTWLGELGCEYGSKVTLGVEWYDTREYGSFTLPRGYYTSLRVMLGEAEGANWWCVMYPPLCLDIASEDAPKDDAVLGYTEEEYTLITTDGYNVKLKILELFSDAFSKNG